MKSHAQIAVEWTHGPILLISGEDDGVWESSAMANAVVGQLKSAHFSFPVEHLKYPRAGHRAGRPEIVPALGDKAIQPVSGREMNMGGTSATTISRIGLAVADSFASIAGPGNFLPNSSAAIFIAALA
jgi:hypothetical protein